MDRENDYTCQAPMKVLAHQGRHNFELRVTCGRDIQTLMRETRNGWEFEKIPKVQELQKLQELQNLPGVNVQAQMNNQRPNVPAQNIISGQMNPFAQPPVQNPNINVVNH